MYIICRSEYTLFDKGRVSKNSIKIGVIQSIFHFFCVGLESVSYNACRILNKSFQISFLKILVTKMDMIISRSK